MENHSQSNTFVGMRLLFIILFALAYSSDATVRANPKHEIRAVWYTTLMGLDWPRTQATDQATMEIQKQELCRDLDRLQKDGINLIYLQTRTRGAVIYPSAIEPIDAIFAGKYGKSPGYDPLAFAIDQCHRRGIECHAWIVTIPYVKTETARKLGKHSLVHTNPGLLFRQNDMYYLDPASEETEQYLSRICQEIARNYDVDGIHFDYIRYPENTPSNRQQWRRDNITRIVRKLYNTIKAEKAWLRISCSPVGKYYDVSRYPSRGWNAYDTVFQDAVSWMHQGIMDMISPMMYFKGDHFYPFCADWQEQCNSKLVAPGLGIYFLHPDEKNWDLTDVTRELCYIRSQGMSGAAFFRARFLLDDVKGLETWIRNFYYTTPAIIPPLTTEQQAVNSNPNAPSRAKRYILYASTDYPVDTTNPHNLVRVYWGQVQWDELTRRLWGMHLAVTELDDYGNESEPRDLTPAPRRTQYKFTIR